jgi:hypothetical protein
MIRTYTHMIGTYIHRHMVTHIVDLAATYFMIPALHAIMHTYIRTYIHRIQHIIQNMHKYTDSDTRVPSYPGSCRAQPGRIRQHAYVGSGMICNMYLNETQDMSYNSVCLVKIVPRTHHAYAQYTCNVP